MTPEDHLSKKMKIQQLRGLGKIQCSYKTSLLKQKKQTITKKPKREIKSIMKNTVGIRKTEQNRQDQKNQPCDKGKKKYN